jgi:hypothetical protein
MLGTALLACELLTALFRGLVIDNPHPRALSERSNWPVIHPL